MWFPLFLFGLFGAAACVALACVQVRRLSPGAGRAGHGGWLWPWAIKGLLVPFLLWVVMNVGVSFQLQPFMPRIQNAQNSGTNWFFPFVEAVTAGGFAISSYWAAITLGWVVWRVAEPLNGGPWLDFRSLCVTSIVAMALPALGIVWAGGWLGLGIAALAVLLPIAGYAPAVLQKPRLPPMYSAAIARMKFGKYSEAEWEILRQLEGAEDDFQGWLLLAELYANQFQDLPEAEQIILEICDEPNATPSQISVALHKLADWHLNLAGDPAAAGRALQVICDRLPRTHLARMAQVRLSQLPRSATELRERQQAATIPLPALSGDFDSSPAVTETARDVKAATALANELSQRLTRDPNDAATRERLARVLAEQLGKAELAIEQIELLLGMADSPSHKRPEWLGLMATWQFKFLHDAEAARQTLERLIREHPDTPQALAARHRLRRLSGESKVPVPPPLPPKLSVNPGPPPAPKATGQS